MQKSIQSRWWLANQRDAYAKALKELGRKRKDIVVLNADLSSSVRTDMFSKEFPERFFNFGVAEQNMMSVAAGLAASGKTVFASTFAVFATGRAFDQVRQTIAYSNLNVKIVASHSGITVGGDGASHQVTEDIGLMRILPNMTIVVPCDAPETYRAVKAIADYKGPVYMRLGRADVPTITTEDEPFEIGKASVLHEGTDVTIIAVGVMVSRALLAAEHLSELGISARVVNMSTIKPLDKDTVINSAKDTGAIVTAEEHSVVLGLGSAVSSVLIENMNVPTRLIGVPDVFGESGDSDELMEKFGLTVNSIVNAVREVIKRKNV
jgi:transketolase